ncbi:MAG: hypothetical protein V1926_04580 [Candidatus Peregrinibacteria bacterium]
MKRVAALSLLLVLSAIALPAAAATFRTSEKETLIISVPIEDDLYAAGGNLQVTENVDGDLIAGGGDVTIVGPVKQDVIVAGGRVRIEGTVGDDARIAGGDVAIAGSIGDDLIVAGGTVRIDRNSVIGGDAIVLGGTLMIDGTVKGKLLTSGGNIVIGGSVDGDAEINGGVLALSNKVLGNLRLRADSVTFGKSAMVGGDMRYWLKSGEGDFGTFVKGTVTFDPSLAHMPAVRMKADFAAAFAGGLVALLGLKFLSGLLAILIFVLITKNFFKDAAKRVIKQPWKDLWYGFLYFAIMPVAAFLLLLTVIGIPFALLAGVSYIFSFVFAMPVTAVLSAWVIDQKYGKAWSKTRLFFAASGCFLLLKILDLIPVIGWIPVVAAVLIAFGALLQTKMERWKKVA